MKQKLSKAMRDYEALLHAAREVHELPEDAYVYPLGDIWAVELLPLIDGSEELRNIHSACMRAWIADHAYLDQRHLADVYSEAEHGGAWEVSKTDYWAVRIDQLVEDEAANEDNPNAQLLLSVEDVLYHAAGRSILAEGVIAALRDAQRQLYKEFGPSRDELSYWVPLCGGNYANVWGYYLAKAWRPQGEWRLISKTGYTVVVDLNDGCVFDLYAGTIGDVQHLLHRAETPPTAITPQGMSLKRARCPDCHRSLGR